MASEKPNPENNKMSSQLTAAKNGIVHMEQEIKQTEERLDLVRAELKELLDVLQEQQDRLAIRQEALDLEKLKSLWDHKTPIAWMSKWIPGTNDSSYHAFLVTEKKGSELYTLQKITPGGLVTCGRKKLKILKDGTRKYGNAYELTEKHRPESFTPVGRFLIYVNQNRLC